jgi:hypothetical protein
MPDVRKKALSGATQNEAVSGLTSNSESDFLKPLSARSNSLDGIDGGPACGV